MLLLCAEMSFAFNKVMNKVWRKIPKKNSFDMRRIFLGISYFIYLMVFSERIIFAKTPPFKAYAVVKLKYALAKGAVLQSAGIH